MKRAFLAAVILLPSAAIASPKQTACIIDAVAQLPQIAGLKIANVKSEPKTLGGEQLPGGRVVPTFRFHDVTISVEVMALRATYKFICREDANNQVTIIRREVVEQ